MVVRVREIVFCLALIIAVILLLVLTLGELSYGVAALFAVVLFFSTFIAAYIVGMQVEGYPTDSIAPGIYSVHEAVQVVEEGEESFWFILAQKDKDPTKAYKLHKEVVQVREGEPMRLEVVRKGQLTKALLFLPKPEGQGET